MDKLLKVTYVMAPHITATIYGISVFSGCPRDCLVITNATRSVYVPINDIISIDIV